MPRVIEAKVGKVVGPLRMKVVPATGTSLSAFNAQTPRSIYEDITPTKSSNLEVRRGRYSRNMNGLKKNRSKSLPSSKEASLLLGKPPEDDEFLHEVNIDSTVARQKPHIYKSQELQVATPKEQFPMNCFHAVNKLPSKDVTSCDDVCRPTMKFEESSQQRYALALDTRCPSNASSNGNTAGNESCSAVARLIRNFKALFKSLHTRGITPCIVASTTARDTARSHLHYTHENKRVATALADLGLGIESHKLSDKDDTTLWKMMDPNDDTMFSHVNISFAITTSGAFSIPLPLNATCSWLLFSAMVDSIIAEDSKISGFVSSTALKASKGPLNVTIVSSDISLFCDTNVDSHRAGLKVFIDHVAEYFKNGLLSSIKITSAGNHGHLGLTVSVQENDENEGPKPMKSCSPDTTIGEQQLKHQKAMQECVHMIEWTLDDIVVGIHPSPNDPIESSLCCTFTVIKNSIVDFTALSHSLIRTALVGQNMRMVGRLRCIDLPVSNDGTHCAISLEASYEIFPFSIRSFHANSLSSDIDDLSTMQLEVVQIVPLPMIDVSLLFGIPLVVRAGLEQDYEQFQEMKVLVRSFFTVLQKQEQAILLRGTSHRPSKKRTSGHAEHVYSGFSLSTEQYFVLMAQENPTSMLHPESGASGPNSGLLFRIAHCDLLLHDKYLMHGEYGPYRPPTVDDQETETQYTEYIENALSTLSVATYNPFTIGLPNNERRKSSIYHEENGPTAADSPNAIHPFSPLAVDAGASSDENFNVHNSSELDISYDTTKLSIYDLATTTTTDDMMDDVVDESHTF